jgi:pimeloyl-ACP methyl ester carboxylesterase
MRVYMRIQNTGATRTALYVLGGLLASAALVQFLSKKAEREHRPIGRMIRVRGRPIHVVDRGTGPCVILLHGNGSMVEDFASTGLIDRLATTHRVLAFDRPGFGESDREDGDWSPDREADLLAEVLEQLGVEQSIVVAHSWATLVAISLAARTPTLITGLVLLSGYYYSSARLDVALMMPGALPIVGPLVRFTVWPLIARLGAPAAFKYLFSPMSVPAAFRRMYSVPMATRPCQLKSLADDTVTMPSAAHHASSTYSAIQIPVRLIAGINDRVVKTSEQSVRLNRELADSELQLLEGVGHMSHHARPDLIIAAVNELSNRVEGDQIREQSSLVGQDA